MRDSSPAPSIVEATNACSRRRDNDEGSAESSDA